MYHTRMWLLTHTGAYVCPHYSRPVNLLGTLALPSRRCHRPGKRPSIPGPGKRLLPVAGKATAPHAGRCAPTLLAVGLCAGTATSTFTAANHRQSVMGCAPGEQPSAAGAAKRGAVSRRAAVERARFGGMHPSGARRWLRGAPLSSGRPTSPQGSPRGCDPKPPGRAPTPGPPAAPLGFAAASDDYEIVSPIRLCVCLCILCVRRDCGSFYNTQRADWFEHQTRALTHAFDTYRAFCCSSDAQC